MHQTNDYAIFKTLEGNRHVNKLHVRRLRNSFQRKYLMSPIIVNEKYEIIDGQHRFEAAKEAGVALNFIVVTGYGLLEVQALNENMKNWKKEDYLSSFCDLGHPEYQKFRDFMMRFPDFGMAACETILTDKLSGGHTASSSQEFVSDTNKKGSYAIRFFQEGGLEIPDYDKAVENAEKILLLKPFYDGIFRPTFVRAIIGVFKIKHYEHSRLIQRLTANPNSFHHCVNVGQYKLMIEDVYNFRSKNKVSLRF